MILKMMAPSYIKGITLLGGEPFEPQNQPALLELVKRIRQNYPEKSIWAFSGYLYEKDILAGRLGDPSITRAFLEHIDVLVDGPFVESLKDLSLRFRGSSNQRLIDVKRSLAEGQTILWEDWQGNRKGMQ